jgi:hypothetical protein
LSTTDRKKKEELTSQQKSNSPVYNAGSGYVESDAVRQAKENLSSLQKPGAYQSKWQQTLDDVINKIQNREKFTYDLNGDALYQQYKNQYITQGQQAMMDTMGQAAALTGGYGSSYGQSVGQQTYQGYLQQLNDKVPELYQLALDQYNREGEDLYNQYGLLADREETDYGRYRDTVADYNTERDYLTGRYDSERDYDYGKYTDERDFNYQVERDEVADKQWQTEYDRGVFESDRNYDYQVGRDEVADKQWQAEFDEDVRQFETNTAITKEQMQIQQKQWQAEFDEKIRQFDLEYQYMKDDLAEKVRSNKISEEQAERKLKLKEAELQQRKAEAANDYAYKMASIGLNTDGTKHAVTGVQHDYTSAKAKAEATSVKQTEEEEKPASGFTGKTYNEAVAYMKSKGVDNGRASGILTASEFSRRSTYKNEFDSYAEYLSYITKYNIENYGK